MTTRVIGTESYTLLYDGALRMVAVQKNGATIAEFVYDGDGQMVSASVGGVITSYVGGYFEWQTNGSLSASTKYYSAGSAKTAMRRAGVVTYLFGDHLGSTSVAYDDGSTTARRQGYTAFGSERYNLGGDLPTRYQYTGQRGFEEIGLYFYNARWYDGGSGVMQWTQPDSLIPDPGIPMDWNRYNFVRYNPLKYSDSSGHFTEDQLRQWYGDNWKEEIQQRFSEDIVVLLMSDDCNLGDVVSYRINGGDYKAMFAKDKDGNLVMWDMGSRDQTTFDSIASSITGFYEGDSSGHYTLADDYGCDGLPESFDILPAELWGNGQFVQQHYEITGIELPNTGGAISLVGGIITSIIDSSSPYGWFFTAVGVISCLEVKEVHSINKIPDISSYPALPPSEIIPGTAYSKQTLR